MSTLADRVDDHEQRLRALERLSHRLLGGIILLSVEIPLVVSVAIAILRAM